MTYILLDITSIRRILHTFNWRLHCVFWSVRCKDVDQPSTVTHLSHHRCIGESRENRMHVAAWSCNRWDPPRRGATTSAVSKRFQRAGDSERLPLVISFPYSSTSVKSIFEPSFRFFTLVCGVLPCRVSHNCRDGFPHSHLFSASVHVSDLSKWTHVLCILLSSSGSSKKPVSTHGRCGRLRSYVVMF